MPLSRRVPPIVTPIPGGARPVESLSPLLLLVDEALQCRFAGAAAGLWLGLDDTPMIGRSLEALLGPDAWRQFRPHLDRTQADGVDSSFDCSLAGPPGSPRSGRAWIGPGAAAGADGWIAIQVVDDSEQRAAEAAHRASEAFLDRTGRLAGVGGWEVDLRQNVVTWSRHTRIIHEVDESYVPNVVDAIQFYAEEARPRIESVLRQALTDGRPWDLELPFITARGRRLWVRTLGEVEFDGSEPVRLVGAFQDVTEKRRRQSELQNEQALRASSERHAEELARLLAERGEMLDVLAHEVRQPLNNASAALQSAKAALPTDGEGSVSPRLTRAQSVLSQVQASIDNTLAVAALLAKPSAVERADTDIDTLVGVSIADLAPEDRGRIRVERIGHTRTAAVDLGLMRLALRNLLANALKFSGKASPVRVRIVDSDRPLAVVIEVCDEGPGVPPDLVGRLFQRGTRRSVGAAGSHGMGLGLYIVRRVMEMHGGHVDLQSGSAGACFRLVVELAPPDTELTPLPAAP